MGISNSTHLDSPIEIQANRGHPAPEIEVARWAVGDTGASVLDQLDFVLAEVTRMSEDGVVPQ